MVDAKKNKRSFLDNNLGIAWLILIGGFIGLIASFMLSVDTYKVLQNPSFQPICNLNPLFNCGSLMKEPQSEAILGIPNSLFGVVGFSFVTMVGIIMVLGMRLKKTFLRLFNIGIWAGVLSLVWFMYESIYNLQHLCLFCMTVWTVTILLGWYVSLWNIKQQVIFVPKRCKRFLAFLFDHHVDGLILLYIIVASLIVQHFWYYFKTI